MGLDNAFEMDPCKAKIERHFSLWPFGTRRTTLYVLLDLSEVDAPLLQGLLKAMQQAYFQAAESRSQTTALNNAVASAHYVLRDHNARALPSEGVTAAAICAVAVEGEAFMALAGDVAALSWSQGALRTHRTASRVARPLGMEGQPKVSYWKAPLSGGDRLGLVCGGTWRDDVGGPAEQVLSVVPVSTEAEQLLAGLLAGAAGATRVMVVEGRGDRWRGGRNADGTERSDTLGARTAMGRGAEVEVGDAALPVYERGQGGTHGAWAAGRRAERARGGTQAVRAAPVGIRARLPSARTLARVTLPVALALILVVGSLFAGQLVGEPAHVALARQAETLLEEAERTADPYLGRQLALEADSLIQEAMAEGGEDYQLLLTRAQRAVQLVDRVQTVRPTALVHLGAGGGSVADVALMGDYVYLLNVAEGQVRRFDVRRPGQFPEAGAVVARAGTSASGAPLDHLVAMTRSSAQGQEALLVMDRTRAVATIDAAGQATRWNLAPPPAWTAIGGFSAAEEITYVVDRGAGVVWGYQGAGHTAGEVAQVAGTPADLPQGQARELSAGRDLYALLDDGTIARFDRRSGQPLPFLVQTPDVPLGPVAGLAADRAGGLLLADPAHQRLIHVAADGRFIRQVRSEDTSAFAQVRTLHTSEDGGTVYAVTGSSLLEVKLPAEVPVPLAAPGGVEGGEGDSGDTIVK